MEPPAETAKILLSLIQNRKDKEKLVNCFQNRPNVILVFTLQFNRMFQKDIITVLGRTAGVVPRQPDFESLERP